MAGENTVAVQVDSLDAVPEALRGLFVKDDATGKFAGEFAKPDVLKEFRGNNIRLAQEREGLAAKIAALGEFGDPAKIKTLQEQFDAATRELATHKTGKSDEELEAELKRRMERKEADHSTVVTNLTTRAEAAETLAKAKDKVIAEELVNTGIAIAAATIPNFTKAPLAIADQQRLARDVWKFEDGKMVPRGEDGKILYGPDGVTYITYEQWLASKTHLIGGGASGGGSLGGRHQSNGDAIVLSRDKAGDVAAYRAAKAEAEKRGVPFSIEPPQ